MQTHTLAIIDLDTNREHGQAENRMIANTSARSQIAREYANHFANGEQTSAFFRKMFDPELIKTDVIEDQARELVERIEARGATVVYLTNRPHTMAEATKRWLAEQGISRTCFFKNYGTGEPGPDGKPDTGDRFVKNTTWKACEVSRLITELETELDAPLDWILFVDDEEANRAAVAELADSRILLRCSLEDAATRDFERREIDQDTRPFLRRLQELASILEMREAFEAAETCQLTIDWPEIPGQVQPKHTCVKIEAWQAVASAPAADQRFYRYNEIYSQRNELSEIEQIIAVQATCDQAGRVISVKHAKPGPALSLLAELEDALNAPEKMQHYADEWIAHAIEEFGYIASARAQRGRQIFGQPALDVYLEYVQAKNAEVEAVFAAHRDQELAHE